MTNSVGPITAHRKQIQGSTAGETEGFLQTQVPVFCSVTETVLEPTPPSKVAFVYKKQDIPCF